MLLAVIIGPSLAVGQKDPEVAHINVAKPLEAAQPVEKVEQSKPVEAAPKAAPAPAQNDSGGNSGVAILERIKKCESGGNYQAQNKSSTASGAYQFLDSTWNNYGGYAKARLAPPSVQDRKAVETYNRSGTRPWNASKSCWS